MSLFTVAEKTLPQKKRSPLTVREKAPWLVCLALSTLYFILLILLATHMWPFDGESHLLLGFCVWGSPTVPDTLGGCYRSYQNSHNYASLLDLVLTFATGYVYLLDRKRKTLSHNDLFFNFAMYVGVSIIICFHGLVHFGIYIFLDCYMDPMQLNPLLKDSAYIVYALFAFFLCTFILYVGFPATKNDDWTRILIGGFFSSSGAVYIAVRTNCDLALTAIFAISHLVASITGLCSPSPIFGFFQGWLFAVATVAGILEITACAGFYRPVGGHAWYDLFLHLYAIASLPFFWQTQKAFHAV